MKNFLLAHFPSLFCSLFLFTAVIAQTEYKIDSIQQFNLDTSSMILEMQLRTHNTFDNNGTKETNELSLIKDMSVWDNLSNELNSYDTNNNIVTSIYQIWDLNDVIWYNTSKTDYTYDAAQNNTLLANYLTFDNGVSWSLYTEIVMQYNANNQITVSTTRTFDFILNTLINDFRDLYSYTNMNNTETIHQIWNGTTSQWVNDEKDTFTYTGNLLTQEDRYHWSTSDWDAMPFERSVLTYNSSEQLLTLTTLVDASGTLVNRDKATNTYTSNRLSETIIQNWNLGSLMWDNSVRITLAYDNNSNLNEYNSYDWIASNWQNNFRLRQFWSVALPFSLGVEEHDLAILKVFPNPFHETLEIRLKSPLGSEGHIQIFDVYGKAITSTIVMSKGEDQLNLDLGTIASGLYVINFNSVDLHKTFKVVKQ